jgi:hypothetical protein
MYAPAFSINTTRTGNCNNLDTYLLNIQKHIFVFVTKGTNSFSVFLNLSICLSMALQPMWNQVAFSVS